MTTHQAEDHALQEAQNALILSYVQRTDRKVTAMALDLTALQSDVAAMQTSVDNAKAALDDLAAQVAGLSTEGVTQEQIDALDAAVNTARTELDAAVNTDNPPA